MGESGNHINGKEVLADAFRELGLKNVTFEKMHDVVKPSGMVVQLAYDVYGDVNDKIGVAGEVDGRLGHTTSQAVAQDLNRDKASLKGKKKVITIRFPTSWLVGEKALSRKAIRDTVIFELKEHGVKIK